MSQALRTAKYLDVERFRGDTFPLQLQLTEDGTAVDVTGWAGKLTVNTEEAPSDTANQLFDVDMVVDDAATGKVSFTPTTGDADQTPGIYYYDVQITSPAGIATRLKGRWTVLQDITK